MDVKYLKEWKKKATLKASGKIASLTYTMLADATKLHNKTLFNCILHLYVSRRLYVQMQPTIIKRDDVRVRHCAVYRETRSPQARIRWRHSDACALNYGYTWVKTATATPGWPGRRQGGGQAACGGGTEYLSTGGRTDGRTEALCR